MRPIQSVNHVAAVWLIFSLSKILETRAVSIFLATPTELSTNDTRHEKDPNDKNSSNPPNIPDFTFRPSHKPSARPSKRPTRRPTGKPTARPSKSPTGKPTARPSKPPTGKPSHRPSHSPLARPSFRPTSRPTPFPTADPTGRPSLTPTVLPTLKPSQTPTNNCKSITGEFGDTTKNSTALKYIYRMELKVGALPSDVLPSVELAVSNALIKSLFTQCSSERRALVVLKNSRSLNGVTVTGISSIPPDVVLPNDSAYCNENVTEGAACFLVEGRLTLFISHDSRMLEQINTVYQSASLAVKSSMDSGAMNNANPSIVKLSYLNDGTNIIEPQKVIGKGSRNTFPVMIAFIMIGALSSVLVGIIGARRYMRKNLRGVQKLTECDVISVGVSTAEWIDFHSTIDSKDFSVSFESTDKSIDGSQEASVVVKWDQRKMFSPYHFTR